MQPDTAERTEYLVNHPDLSLIDLTARARRLHAALSSRLSALECLELTTGLQMVLRIRNEGTRRVGLCAWIATWKGIK